MLFVEIIRGSQESAGEIKRVRDEALARRDACATKGSPIEVVPWKKKGADGPPWLVGLSAS